MKKKKNLCVVALLLMTWLICLPQAVQAAHPAPIGPVRDGSITINVIEWTQRNLVSDAAVSTTVNGKMIQTKTDANGKATFKLPPGTYTFSVMKPGHLGGTASIAVRGGVMEQPFYVCDVASYNYPNYSLSGKIELRDNDYTPSYTRAGVKVVLRYSPASFGPEVPSWLSRSNVYTAATDSNGFYKIVGIVPGIYQFSVAYPGYTGLANLLGTNAWYSDYNPPNGLYLGFLNRQSNTYTFSGSMYKN